MGFVVSCFVGLLWGKIRKSDRVLYIVKEFLKFFLIKRFGIVFVGV